MALSAPIGGFAYLVCPAVWRIAKIDTEEDDHKASS